MAPVALFEKEIYPFHKVCGEYISLESWNFLEEIGIPLSDWNLPIITQLVISSPDGSFLEQDLPLGGFGVSRYKLDAAIAEIAKSAGVTLFENTKVTETRYDGENFIIKGPMKDTSAKILCGSFGKRSNLDVKWKRRFALKKNNKLNNYVGVKYHIKIKFPSGLIALHIFKNGYCGISKIEDEQYCLCYLTRAENLRIANNIINNMEKAILQKNPFLKEIFSSAEFLFKEPQTISQISFEKKTQVENNILFIGDAAGMITPLCGNGMSMALHGAKIAFECIEDFLQNKITRREMERNYTRTWNKQFSGRLKVGRLLQGVLGNEFISNHFIRFVKPFPKLVSYLIKRTHGGAF